MGSHRKIDIQSFSKKQLQVLTWWCTGSGAEHFDAILADGAVRSGKTLSMSMSFVFWSFFRFHGTNFAVCGKTIGSTRRNLIAPLLPLLRSLGFYCREITSRNVVEITYAGRTNFFHLFGGNDSSSSSLIQGITLGGVLLDEEAMPTSYLHPSFHDIYEKHAKPFGVLWGGESGRFAGEFTVAKGSCHWKVIESFAKRVFGKTACLNPAGELVLLPYEGTECCTFSNTKNGIPYIRMALTRKPYGVLGKLFCKTQNSTDYVQVIENPYTNGMGEARYMDFTNIPKSERTTSADYLFRTSTQSYNQIELTACVTKPITVGTNAVLHEKDFSYDAYVVTSTLYSLSKNGVFCKVTLTKRQVL